MQSPLDFFARAARSSPSAAAANVEFAAGHKNMLQLIELRWIAVIGQITTIASAIMIFRIELPLVHMLQVLACLIAFNVASHLRWHERRPVSNGEMFLAILVDVSSLTVLLYLSGGTTNPFAFLYLLQVIVSAVLLDVLWTWSIVLVTIACMAGLAIYAQPLALPFDHARGIGSLYVQGLLVCFALNAALLVMFISRISDNVRDKATQLAALRQRAAEEEHIVRMGLLASGAAHELGTPLSTVSVILGDWKRMPEFRNNPEMLGELTEMQTQLKRCKAIVSGILLSAGEARGESAERTTVSRFLNELAEGWEASRPVRTFIYNNRIAEDLPVASDSALRQTIDNLLDNALEASPDWVYMDAHIDERTLVLTVFDRGPGFAPSMLAHFGKPYHSTKGKPGGGLGLFLAVNVVRKLGGTVTARNRRQDEDGGAEVSVRLPLAAIELEEEIDNAES
ncbi:ATP-binding protein [Massilia arenae]|uniref:histidine kinase n=1 Tax=Massilia arenae TaxID=2603288 RepID=A0A5C7FUN2_9BURK|nr:ATP-binding protein [Massilia arenae]TXF98984.1 HAMP domain-containing histidine kinase [Massilia arenae]